MKKTLNVNIGSQAFTIDEDAYQVLERYYNDIRSRLYEADRAEVMEDVEMRTADIFRENLSFDSQVVNVNLVKRTIATIGSADSFGERRYDTDYSEQQTQQTGARRLYRSRSNVVVGGVCGGVAEYFNIDGTTVRLLTFFLIFFGGLSLWIYIILWIFLPQAPIGSQDHKSNTRKAEKNR